MRVGTAAAIILAAGLGVWMASSGTKESEVVEERAEILPDAPGPPEPHESAASSGGTSAAGVATAPAGSREQTGSEMLDQWLSSSTNPDEIGLAVMLGFSRLPPETHADAARQMVNLVPDVHFDGMMRILLNSKTSDQAKGIIFQDVMIRPDALRLPALLEVLEQAEHPHAKDARYTLGTILGGDWGTDYAQWRTRVDAELRRQKAAGG